MLRYTRLYLYFLRFSFSRAMEFRVDFFFRILMDCVYYFINFYFFKVIYLQTSTFAGWDFEQIKLFMGIFFVMDALFMSVFANNIWMISIYINKGDLDYYLIKPVSSFFFVTLRDFAANSFINLLIAIGYLVYVLIDSPQQFSTMQILSLPLLIVAGTLLHLLVKMLFILPSFWTQSGQALIQLSWTLERMIERPDRIFTGWMRVILTTILPFAILSSFPARLFIDGWDKGIFLHFSTVLIVFSFLIAFIWKRALRAYSSASS